ncbi:MAG: CotH kinase family protein [Clostridia bacterium]|nr:CotH kinase family protein [Clostridia bacterium]
MKKAVKIISFIMAIALLLSACQTVPKEEEKETTQNAYIPDLEYNEKYKLRDKKDLYEMDNPEDVVTMYLTVSAGNEGEKTNHTWNEINTYSVYDYDAMGVDRYKVEGLLQIGDESGPLPGNLGYNQVSPNCTIQIRGQTSSRQAVKNYKISLKENKGTWMGNTTIPLNKHVNEGLRFRNKMAYDLISGVDEMMGLRTRFVHLYVKDTTAGGNNVFTDYGIYTYVEQLNKKTLKAHGLDANSHLYKINEFEFYRYEDVIKLKDDPDFDELAFEELIETKGSDDHEKLIKMLEDVNDFSRPVESILDEHFDIENLSYWMAFHILVGNSDTQNRNVYIYSPLNLDKWYFITWDNDGMLSKTEYAVQNRVSYSEWETGVSNYWGNVLYQRALKSEKFRKALDTAINDLRGYLTKEKIDTLAKQYSDIVKPYVYSYPDILHTPLTPSQYDKVVSSLSSEIETNYKLYKESLKKPMPFFIDLPRKKGNKLIISCESSFDFDSEQITYDMKVARDINFNNIVLSMEDVILPATEIDMLPKGQYFIKVTATNKSGYTQTAFDYYFTDGSKNYGVKCFYIDAKGNVVEDVYEG